MNPVLENLNAYPFQKLAAMLEGELSTTSAEKIMLSIGEPKHPCPPLVLDALTEKLSDYSKYSATKGNLELREAIKSWCLNRYDLEENSLDAESNILPVCGTREALFSFTQAAIDSNKDSTVIVPNPCYQIYEGAALLAGSHVHYLPCLESNGFIPQLEDIPEPVREKCQLIFICSPGNPTGAVMQLDDFKQLFEYADRYNWIIASDECYSEIYYDEDSPPMGLLTACKILGRTEFQNCITFNSLSKRSNLAGMRSGFVAGDQKLLEKYLLYRTYHGSTMPQPVQHASAIAWGDEQHVIDNRTQYRNKYRTFTDTLKGIWDLQIPSGSFYFWAKTPIDDIEFARNLFRETNIVVLPGQYLSRTIDGLNPGKNRVRMALVASQEQCQDAAHRIASSAVFKITGN